jgi:hypothetical protein
MKRGENGSINVSMGPLRQVLPLLFVIVLVHREPNPASEIALYKLSGAQVMDMTVALGEGYPMIGQGINRPIVSDRPAAIFFCSAVQVDRSDLNR